MQEREACKLRALEHFYYTVVNALVRSLADDDVVMSISKAVNEVQWMMKRCANGKAIEELEGSGEIGSKDPEG